MTDVIADDIKQFLIKNIDSIAQWEGLLLMRCSSQTEWTAQGMAKSLYISESEAAEQLEQLRARGFLIVASKKEKAYQYKPNDAALEEMTTRVAEQYRQYLIPITRIIHNKATNQVRGFADAFRIRKD